ncbi:putative integral membrane protein [Amylolactobacillus amylotrophicus DSM 20534]|uniref:DUF368 domain-containing protein n=3 Tax=Amylolactobacillus TaxID=2767876 RepID=A0A1L6XCV7_9LACO|nr:MULTISPECIES: DUF368 domain-containing protein [Amylolactobacillus]APT18821.1 DUF368 domain-containing protein [Amylolactobacillus amylophilus DSM 20533 = JCM 1125]KRK37141.1 putative integral membrane protein [Amylolactobacillus amylotrophicus DSM 20534]KRM43458.1 putative integral membrane protein [Amylolactobacillus amylophilus DSM 20533 = JCM 1125]GED80827.1 DUF368 domain-containing protein [Amylolactobacillus amylophilus]
MIDWILRFVKGIFVGSGFILPGVSGGALAAVFGIYEHIIEFLAHVRRNFKDNFLFLLPVGLGGLVGLVLFSYVVSFALGEHQDTMLWFFVGAIVGTLPALWQQAGKMGRTKRHYGVLVLSFVVSLTFLIFGESLIGNVPQNFGTWVLGGFLIGLGVIVPGLSPSNFLIYMGMYKDMADGIKSFDLAVVVPLALGGVLSLVLLAKLISLIFAKAYASMFHFILGVVAASTVMIIPFDAHYTVSYVLIAILMLLAGAALGWFMAQLETKYETN